MYCSKCGTPNFDDAEFCTSCGNKLVCVTVKENSTHTDANRVMSLAEYKKNWRANDEGYWASLIASVIFELIGFILIVIGVLRVIDYGIEDALFVLVIGVILGIGGLCFNSVFGAKDKKMHREYEEYVRDHSDPFIMNSKKWVCKCGTSNPIAKSYCVNCGKKQE